jgi:hypothetical protein
VVPEDDDPDVDEFTPPEPVQFEYSSSTPTSSA